MFVSRSRGIIISIFTVAVVGLFMTNPALGQQSNCMNCHFVHGQMTNFPSHSNMGCSYCHVPHNSTGNHEEVPLWNPEFSTTTLIGNYSSSTFQGSTADGSQSIGPDGASKLCLSCHDGTHVHGTHKFGAGGPMGMIKFSHPISFIYDSALVEADGELIDPSMLANDVLDGNSKLQCTSCHDIHQSVVQSNSFLRWPYTEEEKAAFCQTCHLK